MREWSRRSAAVRTAVSDNDNTRIDAIKTLFVRHRYSEQEALMRARILYYMQIGYYALDLGESTEVRLANLPGYLYGFTGQHADEHEIDTYLQHAKTKRLGVFYDTNH